MKASDKSLLEFITRLAYNIDGLSSELKLYFSQFLNSNFSNTLSKDQIEDIENRKASRALNHNDWEQAALIFSKENSVWCVAALRILQKQAEKIDDRIVSRKIGQLINELISAFGLQEDDLLIKEEQHKIERQIYQFQNRTTIKIPTRIWPLVLDYIIRFMFLFSFSFWQLNKGYLALFNALIIPLFIVALAYLVGRSHNKANAKLLNAYGGASTYKIEFKVSVNQYTWLAFFLSSSIFISYLLPDQLHVFAFFGLTIYYFLYLRFFRVGRLNENDLVRQLEQKKIDTHTLNVDENDEVIVALETKLNSSTSRLEAYVLESALFGALTFSGFLQIMATDLVSFKDLENFASYIFSTSQAFIHFDWQQFDAGVAGLSDKKSLFCLVSAQSLICSIFFLAVIASRLRFSDIADKVRTALNLAKVYNAKEEVLHDEQAISGKVTTRLEALTTKVNEQLYQANMVLEEINPVMQYMQYFRNAGILVFLVILISSSLFITSVLGWTFLVLAIATYFYFNRTQIGGRLKAFTLNFRIEFVKRGYWLLALAFLPQLLGFIIRVFFHVRDADWLFAVSYSLVGLYLFAWLILAAHVDERFGEIEVNSAERTRLSRWNFVKNTLAVLILMASIGVTFKQLHFQGANEILILSLGFISMLMFFVGYYLTKVKWIGIICGWTLAVCSIGALFKAMHFEGANEMRIIGITCSLILIPLIVLRRSTFHYLMIRFCIATIVIGIFFSPVFDKLRLRAQISYDHETFNIKELLDILEANQAELFLKEGSKAVEIGIEKSDNFVRTYGKDFGFTMVHRSMAVEYESFAAIVLSQKAENQEVDSTLLLLALKAVRQEYKIAKLFNFEPLLDYGLESKILLAMGKLEDAIFSLKKMEESVKYENDKIFLREKLVSLKKKTP